MSQACETHAKVPVKGFSSCAGCEIESLNVKVDKLQEIIEFQKEQLRGWISVDEKLPERGVMVLVYTPRQPSDWPDDIRIDFDCIDPEGDGEPDAESWAFHNESHEHFMAIGGPSACGPDCEVLIG